MRTYALIGRNLSHSFSHKYFQKKFYKEGIENCQYLNFEIENISSLREVVRQNNIKGLNITIPFKEKVIPFLDETTKEAKEVGAVNTIQIKAKKLIGHNTDILGFEQSILPIIDGRKNAIVLGNGGASKAIQYVLKKINIECIVTSRSSDFSIEEISERLIKENTLIINATPLGMYPNTAYFPNLPYNALNTKHLLFDLVYNPEESLFLKHGKKNGAQIKNGKQMLYLQAEESWRIWN